MGYDNYINPADGGISLSAQEDAMRERFAELQTANARELRWQMLQQWMTQNLALYRNYERMAGKTGETLRLAAEGQLVAFVSSVMRWSDFPSDGPSTIFAEAIREFASDESWADVLRCLARTFDAEQPVTGPDPRD